MSVDAAAEAIYAVVTGEVYSLKDPTPWSDIGDVGRQRYRKMAEAAIKGLRLRVEQEEYVLDGRDGRENSCIIDGQYDTSVAAKICDANEYDKDELIRKFRRRWFYLRPHGMSEHWDAEGYCLMRVNAYDRERRKLVVSGVGRSRARSRALDLALQNLARKVDMGRMTDEKWGLGPFPSIPSSPVIGIAQLLADLRELAEGWERRAEITSISVVARVLRDCEQQLREVLYGRGTTPFAAGASERAGFLNEIARRLHLDAPGLAGRYSIAWVSALDGTMSDYLLVGLHNGELRWVAAAGLPPLPEEGV